MELKVQDSELANAISIDTPRVGGDESAAQAGSSDLPEGFADAYESSGTTDGEIGTPPDKSPAPESPGGDANSGPGLKASFLKLSVIGHALTSTVGSAERAARSVVDRVRGLFQEGRERADFMTRRNARRLGDEPANAADRLGSTPQAAASAETSTASPKIDPDLFKNV